MGLLGPCMHSAHCGLFFWQNLRGLGCCWAASGQSQGRNRHVEICHDQPWSGEGHNCVGRRHRDAIDIPSWTEKALKCAHGNQPKVRQAAHTSVRVFRISRHSAVSRCRVSGEAMDWLPSA